MTDGDGDTVVEVRHGGVSADLEHIMFELGLAFPKQPKRFFCTAPTASRLILLIMDGLQRLNAARVAAGMPSTTEASDSVPFDLRGFALIALEDGRLVLRLQTAGDASIDIAMPRPQARALGKALQDPGRFAKSRRDRPMKH